jgi:hypothetical protein
LFRLAARLASGKIEAARPAGLLALEVLSMRIVPLLLISLVLSGCLARTAVSVATLPVRAAGAVGDALTTSQAEADRNRGRAMRKQEERERREARRREREARAQAQEPR